MLARVAIVVTMLVGCGGSAPKTKPPSAKSMARSSLPAEIQPFIPKHGIYVAGGGTSSTVFRVIVDFDAHTIYSATAPAGSALHGKLSDEHTRELTPPNQQHLTQMGVDVWAEEPPAPAGETVKGYDEYLVVPDLRDETKVVFIHEQAPINDPIAKKLIEEVRAAAAL